MAHWYDRALSGLARSQEFMNDWEHLISVPYTIRDGLTTQLTNLRAAATEAVDAVLAGPEEDVNFTFMNGAEEASYHRGTSRQFSGPCWRTTLQGVFLTLRK